VPYSFAYATLPKTVVIDLTGSSDPDGFAITAYSLTLLDRPATSAAALVDNGNGTFDLTMDQVGAYHVFAEVTDAQGEQSEPNPFKAKDPAHGYLCVTTDNRAYWMPALGERNWKGRVESIWKDIDAQLGTLTSHLDGGNGKHDATEIDYERDDGQKKNIQAGSDNVEAALTDLDDATGALADLDTTDKSSVVAAINEVVSGAIAVPQVFTRAIGDGETVTSDDIAEIMSNGRVKKAAAGSIVVVGIVLTTSDGVGPTTGDPAGSKTATILYAGVVDLRIAAAKTVNAGKRVKVDAASVNTIEEAAGTIDGSFAIALQTGTGNTVPCLLSPIGDV
jgi:hypothetical protein